MEDQSQDSGKQTKEKNIVICFDGTSNQFGNVDTNVIRLVQIIDRDPLKQRLYYDPGVGTLPEPNVATRVGKDLSELGGLAFGVGLIRKVGEAYSYLMETWEPGDKVFIFGFSRGAYSARVLAGVLHAFGLLSPGNQNMIPYMMRLFDRAKKEPKSAPGQVGPWHKLCDSFRWTLARQVDKGDDQRRFPVHFVGVWDTVSSVGSVWNPHSYPYTASNPSVKNARHAVAMDERRAFFWQNLLHQTPGQDLKEVWFAGSHCDVGGGYPEKEPKGSSSKYAGTWRCAFKWMVNEAKTKGLHVDPTRLEMVLARTPACIEPWTEAIHNSLWAFWPPWEVGEVIPKWTWDADHQESYLRFGFGKPRTVAKGALIDKTALLRIQKGGYSPGSLSPAFINHVKSLATLPDVLPYDPLD